MLFKAECKECANLLFVMVCTDVGLPFAPLQVHRKTLNPVFNETFQFGVPLAELHNRKLHFSIYDFDRFSRHDLIGQVVVDNLLDFSEGSGEKPVWRDIVEGTAVRVSSLCLGISLLFLAQWLRHTVTSHLQGCGGESLPRSVCVTLECSPCVHMKFPSAVQNMCLGARCLQIAHSVMDRNSCHVLPETGFRLSVTVWWVGDCMAVWFCYKYKHMVWNQTVLIPDRALLMFLYERFNAVV